MMMEGLVINASKKRMEQNREEDFVQEKQENPKKETREIKIFHLPKSRIAQLEEMYSTVVVRDFNDGYHLTEEEKRKANDLYEVFKPIQKHKTRYNNIVDYVIAMRDCYNFVVTIAKKNRMLMDPDEFIEDVFSGKIEVARLQFPVYKGRDRKDINWKNVSRYVVDQELDPNELSGKVDINYIPVDVYENPEEHLTEYFSEDQIAKIFDDTRDDDSVIHSRPFDSTIDEDPDGVVLPVKKKELKKLMKRYPDLIRPVKNVKVRDHVEGSLRDFAFELNSDAYEYIGKLDEKRGFIASDKRPTFSGNVMNKDDVKRYLYQLDEFEENYGRVNYHGTFITVSDYKDELLKEGLTKAGWNVMNLYQNKEKMKQREKEDKRDKKKEKRLRKELSKITSRRERRKEYDDMINSKKRKHKKGSKKKAKAFENVVASGSGKDFDEYEAMMLDMSYNYKSED